MILRFLLFWSITCCVTFSLEAQVIKSEERFPVKGYSVFENGYPIQVVPGPPDQFCFLEFWNSGAQGRTREGHYIQCYGTRNYVEFWYQPAQHRGFHDFEVKGLEKVGNNFWVFGYKVPEDGKHLQTFARIFDPEGNPAHEDPISISNDERKRSNSFEDRWIVAPKGKFVGWMGESGRKTYLSLIHGNGTPLWDTVMTLPHIEEDYRLKRALLKENGTWVFLMLPKNPLPGKPALITSYNGFKESWSELWVNAHPTGEIHSADMLFTSEGELIISGLLTNTGESSLMNGENLSGSRRMKSLSGMFFHRYTTNPRDDMAWVDGVQELTPVPARWIHTYGKEERIPNFSEMQLIADRNHVVMLLEERFKNRKRQCAYDIGAVCFQIESGKSLWGRRIKKRQRTSSSPAYLSFVPGISGKKLRLVYLSEINTRGNLVCTSIELDSGKRKDKAMASNDRADYQFFPDQSGMVSTQNMVLIGRGGPLQNDFKLMTVSF
ncbi:hypothetical protein [Pontibacter sp. G13]|uniref:hypothetical protein n=1 Tax=Pontibacter sp. G13 TaxID=3074898 RepID=UPI00288A46A4|nr:hypothetical protein [Pontibacter sp. G13]WNJ16929.1 hypothetical protein RJD25_18915 [Pontibacter sp. G13]